MQLVDISGNRYGRLIRRKLVRRGKGSNSIFYECLCDCGNIKTVTRSNLMTGTTRSCGCLYKDVGIAKRHSKRSLRISEVGRYYRRNAKQRGLLWELTRENLELLMFSQCEYCGYKDDAIGIGIDRVDNKEGYITSNCVPCCRWCNWGKNERSLDEFQDWVRRLHANLVHQR